MAPRFCCATHITDETCESTNCSCCRPIRLRLDISTQVIHGPAQQSSVVFRHLYRTPHLQFFSCRRYSPPVRPSWPRKLYSTSAWYSPISSPSAMCGTRTGMAAGKLAGFPLANSQIFFAMVTRPGFLQPCLHLRFQIRPTRNRLCTLVPSLSKHCCCPDHAAGGSAIILPDVRSAAIIRHLNFSGRSRRGF